MKTQLDEIENLNEWHKCSRFNEFDILESEVIGCFHCLCLFRSKDVLDDIQWCDDHSQKGKTAICPKCHIDSILPVSSDEFEASRILKLMNERWFIDI